MKNDNFNHTQKRIDEALLFRIMEPKNFPLACFPFDIKNGLPLIKQIIVNQATGKRVGGIRELDSQDKPDYIRDVIANKIAEQAKELAVIRTENIHIGDEYASVDFYTVDKLPKSVMKNRVLINSDEYESLKEVIDELQKYEAIDELLLPKLTGVNYFTKADGCDENWGLFCADCVNTANRLQLCKTINSVIDYLESNYASNENIYTEFLEQYETVKGYRQEIQKDADVYMHASIVENKLKKKLDVYEAALAERTQELDELKDKMHEEITRLEGDLKFLSDKQARIKQEKEDNKKSLTAAENLLKKMSENRPGVLSGKKAKENYKADLEKLEAKIQELKTDSLKVDKQLADVTSRYHEYRKKYASVKNIISTKEDEIKKWSETARLDFAELESESLELKEYMDKRGVRPLDVTKDYETIMLSRPWFDERYRTMQAELFISALAVRKQFLYENLMNLKTVCYIAEHQSEVKSIDELNEYVYEWINLIYLIAVC